MYIGGPLPLLVSFTHTQFHLKSIGMPRPERFINEIFSSRMTFNRTKYKKYTRNMNNRIKVTRADLQIVEFGSYSTSSMT